VGMGSVASRPNHPFPPTGRNVVFSCCSLICCATSFSSAHSSTSCPMRAACRASAEPQAPPPSTDTFVRSELNPLALPPFPLRAAAMVLAQRRRGDVSTNPAPVAGCLSGCSLQYARVSKRVAGVWPQEAAHQVGRWCNSRMMQWKNAVGVLGGSAWDVSVICRPGGAASSASGGSTPPARCLAAARP
jgi:hypothetical protein